MSFKVKFSNLGSPRRIWALPAIHGDLTKLRAIHDRIFERFIPGDKIVYTGNYLGALKNADPIGTLDEILYFRRSVLARPGVDADDFVYLRGRQEELLRQSFRLQMSLNASQFVEWMARSYPAMDSILQAYGSSLESLTRIAREGTMSVTRWGAAIQNNLRQHPGHEKFFTVLKRAAFTENSGSNDNDAGNILLVHAGIDPNLTLTEQDDQFWWADDAFRKMQDPYAPFRTVIRGHDPECQGVQVGGVTMTLDGGCGYGGKLVCAELSCVGEIVEMLSA